MVKITRPMFTVMEQECPACGNTFPVNDGGRQS